MVRFGLASGGVSSGMARQGKFRSVVGHGSLWRGRVMYGSFWFGLYGSGL
jgi:hypothetical protein